MSQSLIIDQFPSEFQNKKKKKKKKMFTYQKGSAGLG